MELFNAPAAPPPFTIMPDVVSMEPALLAQGSFAGLQPGENPADQSNGNVMLEEQASSEEDLASSTTDEESTRRSFLSRLLRR
jgi:hypothetical protein